MSHFTDTKLQSRICIEYKIEATLDYIVVCSAALIQLIGKMYGFRIQLLQPNLHNVTNAL